MEETNSKHQSEASKPAVSAVKTAAKASARAGLAARKTAPVTRDVVIRLINGVKRI